MVKRRLNFVVVATCMTMCAIVAGESQAQNGAPDKPAKIEALYGGSRATKLLAAQIKTKDGKSLGQIRNLILRGNGKIDSIISEQTGLGVRAEFVIRIPWGLVAEPFNKGVLTVDLAKGQPENFALFQPNDNGKDSDMFPVTSVVGDYVRLQTGRGYGYVSDVVFGSDGVMSFIIVTRGEDVGGGKFAFPYPGQTGRWDARLSYYGLPFVTEDQATASAHRVDVKRLMAK